MDLINGKLIFLPVLALVFWTFIVLLMLPFRRFALIRSGQVSINDFKLQETDRVADSVVLVNRNYTNLLEMPVLFYLACVLLYLLERVTPVGLILAWSYLGLRVLHSLIHLTYNRVFHRFLIFALSNVVLLLLWLLLAQQLLIQIEVL
ncbi:MAPEG family protein [Oceanospirillum sanctuarii]|uniref:MAPEG family protein n=1 Tax=Oceanospirillum sanctuarii TaxID=1434821 RepID=UPI000A3A9C5D|nr:MAPEG family protein [Oceanospirillum sanctuarii]